MGVVAVTTALYPLKFPDASVDRNPVIIGRAGQQTCRAIRVADTSYVPGN